MKKGDYVVHWSGKVCMIDNVADLDFTGTKREYLILTPVRDAGETIYVPVDKADGILRPILSKPQAEELVTQLKDIEPLLIKDEKQRTQEYKKAFYSQNYINIVKIAKELYIRKDIRTRDGKKLPSRDAQMISLVEMTFEEEMAIALDVKLDDVKRLMETGEQA